MNNIALTTTKFDAVHSGFRLFVRMLGHQDFTSSNKHTPVEMDAIDALDCVKIMIRETQDMVGKQKHPGKTFDFVSDIKSDMAEMLLVGKDTTATAMKRKRNLALYYLVVDPVVDLFGDLDHQTAIDNAEGVIDYIVSTAFKEDDYGTHDDALVAQVQIRQLIQEREAQIKAEATARKKKSRKETQVIKEDNDGFDGVEDDS